MHYIHESSYIDEGSVIGNGTKIWHFCHVSEGAVIGENSSIGQNVYIGKDVHIGSNVKIQNNVSVYSGVTIEDGVFLGPSCVFTNDLTPRAEFPKGESGWKKTVVHKGATIGANATIICGNDIGEYAMVGAGAVVTNDVEPYMLVVGVPAKEIGKVDKEGNVMKGTDTAVFKSGGANISS